MTDLEPAIAEHRHALEDVLRTFRALPEASWNLARAAGKWSPAQIAEHLRLTYAVAAEEARGGRGMRIRAPWWLRPWLRLRYAGRILRTGEFPAGAPAVREIRPGDGPFEREPLLGALAAEGKRFLTAAQAADERVIGFTHPFFGKLALSDGLRLATQHLRHHERQVLPTSS